LQNFYDGLPADKKHIMKASLKNLNQDTFKKILHKDLTQNFLTFAELLTAFLPDNASMAEKFIEVLNDQPDQINLINDVVEHLKKQGDFSHTLFHCITEENWKNIAILELGLQTFIPLLTLLPEDQTLVRKHYATWAANQGNNLGIPPLTFDAFMEQMKAVQDKYLPTLTKKIFVHVQGVLLKQ
jgi:hypothetical protein